MDIFNSTQVDWKHLLGDSTYDYPIDYWYAILSARKDGHIDMLFRWEPNAYCHFHRHLVDTTTTVIQGEHHVIEMDKGIEIEHKVRLAGDYAHAPAGDLHMEYAGSEGSLLLFNMYAPEGRLFEILDREENILMTATVSDFLSGDLAAEAA